MSEPNPEPPQSPEGDSFYCAPPPGWDPDDDWEPSNNDSLHYATCIADPTDPNDFYDP
ncbi:hypothetical protein GPA10_05170 [Streptomyces sp. p1417]|uniref:Uncharacterized protein n=1 Tax=Streptomyces typhae TaxID=2681492 RepID=A0A6L6WR57_9ACTN|nr:hypothetical protein [Streptomyces typhae]MVO84177.1 hypothetical protein [Streptomyces typhae]